MKSNKGEKCKIFKKLGALPFWAVLFGLIFVTTYLCLNAFVGLFFRSSDHFFYVWKKIENPPLILMEGYYKCTPGNYTDSFYKTAYSIGEDGFRVTPHGKLTSFDFYIAVVGESSTVCLENPETLIWSEILARSLGKKLGTVKVKNFGMRGARSVNLAGIINDEVLPRRPDLILVYAGFNDVYRGPSMFYPGKKEWPAGYFNWLFNHLYMIRRKAADLAYGLGLPYPVWLSDIKWKAGIGENFTKMIVSAKSQNVPIVIVGQVIGFPPGIKLDTHGKLSRKAHLLSLKSEWGDTLMRIPKLVQVQKTIAENFPGTYFVDISDAFFNDGFQDGFFNPDPIHLTEQGNKRLADALTKPLLEIIRKERPDLSSFR